MACIFLFLFVWTAMAQTTPLRINEGSLKTYFESAVPPLMEKTQIPGAAVVVVKDAGLLYSGQWGFADLKKSIPVQNERTIFRLGSVSKPFTALAVLQLAGENRLSLNEDANRYVKLKSLYHDIKGPVTIANLLTHTGGFEETLIHTAWRERNAVLPLGLFLQKQMPARVLPAGKFICYSNHGFVLLGYIIEKVTGKSFGEYLRENIWRPLEMKHTFYGLPPEGTVDMATGYESGGVIPLAHVQIGPAAAACATPSDMAHFLIALLNHGAYDNDQVFRAHTEEWLLGKQFTNFPGLPGMTYGLFESNYNNRRSLYHEGGIRGFSSLLYLMPDDHFGMFIVNNGYQQGFHWQICDDFLNHFFSAKPASHAPPPDFAAQSKRYAGHYQFLRYSRTTIEKLALLKRSDIEISSRSDGTLDIGGTRFVEIKHDLFQEVGSYERAGFLTDSKGTVTHVSIDQDALERVPWYKTSSLHQFLLFFFLVVFIASRFGWCKDQGSLLLENQDSSGPVERQVLLLKRVNLINLIFLLSLIIAMLRTKPGTIWFGVPKIYYIIFSLPLLSAILTVFLLAQTYGIARNGNWKFSAKARFALIVIIDLLFFPYLQYWNLLGFHF